MAAPSPQPNQPSNVAQIYTSVPLPLGSSDTIRLLCILDYDPQDDDAPISCEMTVASMTEPYVALSYMWGEAAASETITLNGSRILIRKNLWDFLHQRRKDQRAHGDQRTHDGAEPVHEPQYLWIDALCIDQETNSEKTHQVALMSRIYSSAAYVISWLGAPARLPRLWDYINAYQSNASSNQHRQGMTSYSGLKNDYIVLYNHPYWSRAWILQECSLASELRIQQGSQHVLENIFFRLWKLIRHSLYRSWLITDALYVLETRRRWRDPSTRTYFRPWDHSFWGQNGLITRCTDPRDLIFSAIAIMDPALGIVPDYSKTVEELFIMIADQSIEWDIQRYKDIKTLAENLGLATQSDYSSSWKDSSAEVRQRLREAKAFQDGIWKFPGLTRSEFLAAWRLNEKGQYQRQRRKCFARLYRRRFEGWKERGFRSIRRYV